MVCEALFCPKGKTLCADFSNRAEKCKSGLALILNTALLYFQTGSCPCQVRQIGVPLEGSGTGCRVLAPKISPVRFDITLTRGACSKWIPTYLPNYGTDTSSFTPECTAVANRPHDDGLCPCYRWQGDLAAATPRRIAEKPRRRASTVRNGTGRGHQGILHQ